MRWIKHLIHTRHDEKVARLIADLGYEGYGYMWAVFEVVGSQVDDTDRCELTYPLAKWGHLLETEQQKAEIVLNKLAIHRLIGMTKDNQNNITVRIPNILKYRDEYAEKRARKKAILSGQYPDTIPTLSGESPRRTELDTEQIQNRADTGGSAFESFVEFWNTFASSNGLAMCSKLTKSRKDKFSLRAKDGLMDKLPELLDNILRSRFLLGKSNGNGHENWKVSIDFILANDTNWVKIVEGKYSSGSKISPGSLSPDSDYDEDVVWDEQLKNWICKNCEGSGMDRIVPKEYKPHKRGTPFVPDGGLVRGQRT